jgi:hypothetical protein
MADNLRGGTRRRTEQSDRVHRRKAQSAALWREPTAARTMRGRSEDYDAPPGQASWVIQPFELGAQGLRFPVNPFNYSARATIASGAASATQITVNVPEQYLGVLRSLVVYSLLPAGIQDLTQLELLVDGIPSRGLQVPGAAPAALILPDAAFEDPELTYNIKLRSGQQLVLTAGRTGGADPAAYTYVFRLKGWYWPKYRRRGF